jgi:phospholipase C
VPHSLTSKLVAMTSRYQYKLALSTPLILGLFFLAGCQGLGTTPSPTPTVTDFQLTVTGPTSSTGTVTSSPKGISCPGTCSASFASNTQVTLTEQPTTNNFFTGWSGGSCSGTASTCTLTLSAATSVSAAFNGGDSLTVAVTGTGNVTSNPKGISCPGNCTASFGTNTQVILTESPGSGQYFSGWSGSTCSGTAATCTVTLAANSNVSVSFAAGVTMTVALAGAGAGTVTDSTGAINCSAATTATCTASFAPNTAVTLTETPISGDTFAGWGGACTGTAGCSVTLSAASNVTATFGGSLANNIDHIILYAQENRSFDHYFGAMRKYWADNGIPDQQFDGLPQFNPPFTAAPPSIPGCSIADSATGCTVDPTNQISSFHLASACIENPSPFWNEAHNDWDYQNPADQPAEVNSSGQPDPPLNGFVWTAAYDARSDGFMDVMGVRAMGYYDGTDLNYYYALASDFGISDRWFAPVMSRTQINRMYMLAGTSYGYAYPEYTGPNDSALAPSLTIIEALQNAGVSWKIYINPTGLSYAGQGCTTDYTDANAICMLRAFGSYIDEFTYFDTILNSGSQTPDLLKNIAPIQQFALDASSNSLASFSLIEPASSAGLDEHPSDSDGYPVNVQDGQQYSADYVVNPLLSSPQSWADSVLIFTYDEPGGLYDHVSPQPAALPGDGFNWPVDLDPVNKGITDDICTKPGEVEGQGTCSFGWTTYRIPNVVISPYSIKNYVSHTVRDTTSVLAMVEARFGINALTGRDASQPNMNEYFDFVNEPWATPPTLPTPAKTLTCNQTPPASWQEPPLLTVVVTPDGFGSITGTPGSGLDGCTTQCSSTFATGTVVTLTATPNGGSNFTGWSGGGCTGTGTCSITMSSSVPQTTVTATFTP